MKNYNYHYVYRITNTETNMYYYGDRSCNYHPSEDIGIRYFSSFSESWYEDDQKTNPQNYKYKIIKIFETCRSDAKDLEIKLHERFDVKNHPRFINKANQTSTSFCTSGTKLSDERKKQISIEQKGRKDSEETKRKKSASLKGRKITWGDKLSLASMGKEPWNKGLKLSELSGENNSFYGKQHTDETKKIISEKSKSQWNNYSTEEKWFIIDKRSQTRVKKCLSKGMNNPTAKIYKVVSPSGLETICKGTLKDFCRLNNLDCSTMYDIAKGLLPKTKRSKHYGWIVEEIIN